MIIVNQQAPVSAAIYQTLLNGVYALTKRPDLSVETAQAVRKATMKAHMADSWKNDLTTVIVTLPVLSPVNATSFRYQFDLNDSVQYPLFKRISQVKEYNPVATGQEIQFKELDADRLLDDYQLEDINYWYQVGKVCNLRCNKVLSYLAVGYWKYPNTVPAQYTSWIASEFPDIIIEEAASYVFKAVGKDTEYVRFRDTWEENIALLRAAHI